MQPVAEASRIESLDVLRGFALLGILLLNIVGFGMYSAAYSSPGFDLLGGSSLDLGVWVSVELLAEGAMRCLFSMLFGAGVLLFTTGEYGKTGALHYKRTFWLLAFGLFDAYVLLWNGDILVTYGLAGAVLYLVRNVSASRLLTVAIVFIVFMSLFYAATRFGLGQAYQAAQTLAAATDPASVSEGVKETAAIWHSFAADWGAGGGGTELEYALRGDGYATAFWWNADKSNEMLFFVLPLILFWDAMAMMLLGMALYKYGILQGDRAPVFYLKLMLAGFSVGLLVNGFEVSNAISNDFDMFSTFAQIQPTYHIGRLGMACGYMGLLLLVVQKGIWPMLRRRLAAVGRMALTNYLSHSIICMFVFTGAGLALVGSFSRAQLYIVVFAIWVFQLFFSQWWLERYRFGPLEWLWRALTYGERPTNRRS